METNNIIINSGIDEDELVQPLIVNLSKHFSEDRVSVSLKYYSGKTQCFSEWNQKELKKLTSIIDFLAQISESDAKSNKCHAHKGPPKSTKFIRPKDLSPDIMFYSMKVTDKSRIHGFFLSSIFFLVWLDRNHECLKG